MAYLSSNFPVEEKFNGLSSELRAQLPNSFRVIPLSNENTRDLEQGTTDPASSENHDIPRVDGGKDAWLFLAACFVFEALIWGKSCVQHQNLLLISNEHTKG